jgi:hypothetical protein
MVFVYQLLKADRIVVLVNLSAESGRTKILISCVAVSFNAKMLEICPLTASRPITVHKYLDP